MSFSGPWTEADQAVITRTLKTVEKHMDLPSAPPGIPLWVCSHVTAAGGWYIASRYRMEAVVKAPSVIRLRVRLLDRAGALGTY